MQSSSDNEVKLLAESGNIKVHSIGVVSSRLKIVF